MNNAWESEFQQIDDFSFDRLGVLERMNKDKEQLEILETTYKDAMLASKVAGDQEKEVALLEDALARLENVSGTKDGLQVKAQIESIKSELLIKKNVLLTNLFGLKAIEGKVKLDQIAKDRETTKEGAAFGVCDPYHLGSYEKKAYERPTGQGMIDF
jgi:hypothetical protein